MWIQDISIPSLEQYVQDRYFGKEKENIYNGRNRKV